MKISQFFVLIALVTITVSGCLKSANSGAFDQNKQNQLDDQQIKLYLSQHSIAATKDSATGLYYRIDSLGSGSSPKLTDSVVVSYKGELMTTGQVFDSTVVGNPRTFLLENLIPAWQIGLPLIKTGGEIDLYVPSVLGYGYYGVPPYISSNAVLIFNISLVGIK
ncbi:MAG: FKBP-type peptidyl-prolyl cis-trans isomerase [Chitinophagaceae bacterium]